MSWCYPEDWGPTGLMFHGARAMFWRIAFELTHKYHETIQREGLYFRQKAGGLDSKWKGAGEFSKLKKNSTLEVGRSKNWHQRMWVLRSSEQ